MPNIQLREITRETLDSVLDLKVAEEQRQFVADNTYSIAEAHFADEAWFRAIYADDKPVGFVMIAQQPEVPNYVLWRFMIGREHQRKGYGRAAIERLVERVREFPSATELKTSVIEGEGGPLPFYEGLGFVSTGEYMEGELVLRLALT